MSTKTRLEVPALAPVPAEARLAHDRPVLALVAERERDAAVAALVAGAAERQVTLLRASLRTSAGFSTVTAGGALVVHTHPDAVTDALRAALAALPAHDLLVAEGPLALAALRPTLAVAIAPAHDPTLFSRDLRAVRHAVDLFLSEARPALLARLVAALLARHAPA